jgi:hypothetical protein
MSQWVINTHTLNTALSKPVIENLVVSNQLTTGPIRWLVNTGSLSGEQFRTDKYENESLNHQINNPSNWRTFFAPNKLKGFGLFDIVIWAQKYLNIAHSEGPATLKMVK